MSRPFEFSPGTIREARCRQQGLCACCGHELSGVIENAHHVVPNQSGQPHDATHRWLKSVENCVVLCDMCHCRVHQDGRYRHGAVAPPEYFPYSHARHAAAHRHWCLELDALAKLLWKSQVTTGVK